jgi:hypothetical protein
MQSVEMALGLVIVVPESDLEARKAVEALILGTANRGSAGSPNCLQAKVLRGITRSRRVKTDGKTQRRVS